MSDIEAGQLPSSSIFNGMPLKNIFIYDPFMAVVLCFLTHAPRTNIIKANIIDFKIEIKTKIPKNRFFNNVVQM